ncbi:Alpha/beta knot methyltransferase [Blyttiomyces helicus]|uniref:Alpha/beta knot methyltransferase n=1 Tax=Blyttiomyces helicus TaxID=388810 RepID=A0A4P9WH12_9FUNG|nr:Alpha/beta knot methyltransferase [Blyttiomyces helicus]|eukprot:RKO89806.1 Alpha/beta knot methyltransferase [Blyttiomyces helicus]
MRAFRPPPRARATLLPLSPCRAAPLPQSPPRPHFPEGSRTYAARSFVRHTPKVGPGGKNVEMLYGGNVVIPCLQKAGKRDIQALYVRQDASASGHIVYRVPTDEEEARTVIERAEAIASKAGISIQRASTAYLDTLSDKRPNQSLDPVDLNLKCPQIHRPKGLVLAVRPLDIERIRCLSAFIQRDEETNTTYHAAVGKQNNIEIEFVPKPTRKFPVWLALDQVVDPQNLGAILRSAHFFGCDGVVMTEQDTAPLNPVVSKASSGALEVMSHIHTTLSLSKFLRESAENGWHIYGTDIHAPAKRRVHLSTERTAPLVCEPTILVLGSEGAGMRAEVGKNCHDHLIIDGAEESGGVDSLNVSVAAGILLHVLLG